MTETSEGGFMLLEVLVAFAILGLVLLGLSSSISIGVNQQQLSELKMRAAALAEQKLTEAGVVNSFEDVEQTGKSGDGLSWELTIRPIYSSEESRTIHGVQPYWVTVRVYETPSLAGAPVVELSGVKIGATP